MIIKLDKINAIIYFVVKRFWRILKKGICENMLNINIPIKIETTDSRKIENICEDKPANIPSTSATKYI